MEIHDWKLRWIIMAFQNYSVGYLGNFLMVMISLKWFYPSSSVNMICIINQCHLGSKTEILLQPVRT